jgi:hypothetical protein
MSTRQTRIINLNWSLTNEEVILDQLRNLSVKGWHLTGFKAPNYLKLWQGYGLIFDKGVPEERVYRMDYRPGSKASTAEYLQLCEDAGWKNVFSRRSFYIFSASAATAARADFFSDRASKIAKLKRLRLRIFFYGLFLTPGLYYFLMLLQSTIPTQSSVTPAEFTGFVLLIFYMLFKYSLAIHTLQKKGPQISSKADAVDVPNPRRMKQSTQWNTLFLLTLILMPLGASVTLPDWHWSPGWHVAQGIGLLFGYGVARFLFFLRAKTQRLP